MMHKIKKSVIQNIDELEFAIFCIENIANRLGINAQIVYDKFAKESNILNTYIIPNYDILHTQSKDYIIDDILLIMKEHGIQI